MSKPIKITDTILETIMQEFRENVLSAKMTDGKIKYERAFRWEKEEKATLTFSALAFLKMWQVVQGFNSEVAWHGTAYRDADDPSKFRIEDIFVYPQEVTGSTVNTDQGTYQTWLYALDDEQFNNLRMQGHSHVDFSTTPSGVDLTHQNKILDQLDDDMFYIFLIWNKKNERTIKIYDLANNTFYDTTDVTVVIEGLGDFLADAKKMVVAKYQTYQPGFAAAPTSAPAVRPKTSSNPPVGKSGRDYDPGYDDYCYPYYQNGYAKSQK